MIKVFTIIQNSFLLMLFLGMLSLPILVDLNLTPIVAVDEEESTIASNDKVGGGNTKYVEKSKDSEVLGVVSEEEGLVVDFIGKKFARNEKILQSGISQYVSVLTIYGEDMEAESEYAKDNLYLVSNKFSKEAVLSIKVDGEVTSFESTRIFLNVDGDRLEAFNGAEFVEIPQILLDRGKDILVQIEVMPSEKNLLTDNPNLIVRLGLAKKK